MKKQTDKLVNAEIAKLKKMKPKIRRYTAFGDDNWEKVDAEIRVLEKRMDQDDVDEHWDGENDRDRELHSSACDAVEWLEGGSVASPSSEWESLVEK